MFYLPTILASLHHIAAFTLVACLVYEWLTFRQTLAAHEARGLQRIDLWYGVSAVMLLVAGVLRVIYGGKGYPGHRRTVGVAGGTGHGPWDGLVAVAWIGLCRLY
ncbi:MAG: DUF2214 family protein [Chloroflexaceae bacterium]|nr:DUF2214 family protein [Chloroflexaceae bacterium]